MSHSNRALREEYLAVYFVAEVPPKPWPVRFGVITAYNPNGQVASNAANLDADSKLKQCIERSKLPHFRVTGGSLDGSHQEPGFGIVIDDPKGVEQLAREFQQEAFFWIQNGEVYCIEIDKPKMHWVSTWSERQLKKH
jgi:hypothetical protein